MVRCYFLLFEIAHHTGWNGHTPRRKCHYLFAPPLVLNQQAQHGLDLCGLSLFIPRANQAGNGLYFTPSIFPKVKSLEDDYIDVDLTVGGFVPDN